MQEYDVCDWLKDIWECPAAAGVENTWECPVAAGVENTQECCVAAGVEKYLGVLCILQY